MVQWVGYIYMVDMWYDRIYVLIVSAYRMYLPSTKSGLIIIDGTDRNGSHDIELCERVVHGVFHVRIRMSSAVYSTHTKGYPSEKENRSFHINAFHTCVHIRGINQ